MKQGDAMSQPNGWEIKKLGDAFSLIRNGVNCKQNKSKKGDKISRIETIAFSNVNPDKVGYSLLTEEQKKKYKLKKGDILFSHINSVPHVGKTAYFNGDYDIYHGINLLLIRPAESIETHFLEYYLKKLFLFGYWKTICKQSVNQASVNQTDIKKVLFANPPLDEQKRIVAKLDECFEAIDKARVNVEKNLQNAKELFQSQLNEIFSQKGDGWEEKKLGDVCGVQRGLTYSGKDTVDVSNNIVLRATNIHLESSRLIFDELKYLREDFEIKDIYKLKKGSLLICFSSGSKSHLGKVALVDDDYNYAFGGFIGQITPMEKYSSRYLFYNLISERYKKYISELTDGVNINNLKIKDLQAFQIPIPPLDEQKQFADQFDNLKFQTQSLESNYQQELDALDELKKSILQKAFRGEL